MVGEPTIHSKQVIRTVEHPKRLLREWWLIALVTTLAAIGLAYSQATRPLDSLLFDTLKFYDSPDPDPRILLVTFDNESLDAIGPWPWPRSVHAKLINALANGQPKAIGYDVLFAEKTKDDAYLANALDGSAPVFLPLGFETPGRNGRLFDLILPPKEIAKAAAGIGHVNLTADDDGIVRRVRLWDGDGATQIPQMMLRLALSTSAVRMSENMASRSFMRKIIPFAGNAGRYPSVSAAAVLRGELPAEMIKGRFVLVGATATGLSDWHPTSTHGSNGTISGVELQANLLDGLLHNRMIRDGTLFERVAVSLLAPMLLLFGLRRLSPRAVLAAIFLIVTLALLFCAVALSTLHVWLSPVTGIVLVALLYPLWGWRRLSVVNDFMISELEELRASSPGAIQSLRIASNVDPVSRQLILLRETAATMRNIQGQRESMLQFLTHDMRAPQSSIVAAVRTAAARDISPHLADRIEGYAQRTLELADGFVHLARADSAVYEAEPIDFAGIVLDAIDDIWPLLQQNNLSCNARYAIDDDLFIHGDGSLLFRVIGNILHNAIRFSPPSGCILCDLNLQTIEAAEFVVCAISDEGPGIPLSRRPEIFGRFTSVGVSRRGQPSVGLGLAFAETVIVRHGGKIWYEPEPRTMFSVALPHARQTPRF